MNCLGDGSWVYCLDFVRMLHAKEQHIQSLERIIECQEKRIGKLARENEKLKAAGVKQ